MTGVLGREWSGLDRAIAGDVILPGSAGYEPARRPAVENFRHVRPQAVVRCAGPADVSETLAFARRSGVHATPRSGGHCFAGRSSTEGIVIDVTPMRAVSVSESVATVGAGARLADVYDALAEHGVTIPAGCGPTVGIAGLALGGGLGMLGRRHGLTCDSLVAAQVVLADGRVVDCDAGREPDLFWALRGAGGGQFGVVTSLAFDTVPAPPATTFHLTWDAAAAARVVAAWQEWAPEGPDQLSASLQLTVAGDAAQPPAVNLFGVMLASEADTAEAIGGLVARSGASPASAAYARLPYRDAKRSLSEGDDEPSTAAHRFAKSEFFPGPLPPDAIAALVARLTDRRPAGQARELNFTPLGGAYDHVPAEATAFAHRGERFLLEHVALAGPDASSARSARDWLGRSWAAVHPWGSGGVYPNFPDPDLPDPAAAYHRGNLERLRQVKRAYDPERVFRFAQSL